MTTTVAGIDMATTVHAFGLAIVVVPIARGWMVFSWGT